MKKTKAPLILFGFLGVLVCFIIASIVISLKNPVKDDTSYFSSKKEIDYKINALLKEQKWFLKHCKLFLEMDSKEKIELVPPYFRTNNDQTLNIQGANPHTVKLVTQGVLPQEFKAHLYIERINFHQERIELGDITEPKEILITQNGRYKAIVVVDYERDHQDKRIFFEREFFVF